MVLIAIRYYYSSQGLILILSSTDRRKLSEAALVLVLAKDTQLSTLIIDRPRDLTHKSGMLPLEVAKENTIYILSMASAN